MQDISVTHHARNLNSILVIQCHSSGGGHMARKIFISRGVAAFASFIGSEVPKFQGRKAKDNDLRVLVCNP